MVEFCYICSYKSKKIKYENVADVSLSRRIIPHTLELGTTWNLWPIRHQGRRNEILPGGTALKADPEIFKICVYAAVKWPTVRPGFL